MMVADLLNGSRRTLWPEAKMEDEDGIAANLR